jgi:hypothetical protein
MEICTVDSPGKFPGVLYWVLKNCCVLDLNYETEKSFGNSFIDGDGIFLDIIAYNRTIIIFFPFIIPFFAHYMPLTFPNTFKAFLFYYYEI